MKILRLLWLPLVLCVACTSASPTTKKPQIEDEKVPVCEGDKKTKSKLFTRSAGFETRLFAELATSASEQENVFFSPYGIEILLALIANGAISETASEITQALGYDPAEISTANEEYAQIVASLKQCADGVTVSTATALFHAPDLTLAKHFADTANIHYSAAARSVDFSDPAERALVELWVSEQTQDMLSIRGVLNSEIRFLFLNAIYFNGAWTEAFDPAKSQVGDFHPTSQTTEKVTFMHAQQTYGYFSDATATVVGLPYGKNKEYELYAFLPSKDATVQQVTTQLKEKGLASFEAAMTQTEIEIKLPRVSLETSYDTNTLATLLQRLGVKILWTPQADLSGLFTAPENINSIFQKAILKIDEKGTVAAAITGMSVTDSVPPYVVFDRPFVIALRDNYTGVILFYGVIRHPEAK